MKNKKKVSLKSLSKSLSSSLRVDDYEQFSDWLIDKKIITDQNRPYTFDKRGYLLDLANDFSKNQVIRASTQNGKSILYMLKGMYLTAGFDKNYDGMNVIYSLPNERLLESLVKTKIDKLVANNEVFKNITSGNISLKHINKNEMFFVYSNGSQNVGYSGDVLINDECDLSNQSSLKILSGRMNDSPYRWTWNITNPTVSGSLSDRLWNDPRCDKKHWII